jgi:hypothetical protein
LAKESGNQPSFEDIVRRLKNTKSKMMLNVNPQKIFMFVKSINEWNVTGWQQKYVSLIIFEKSNEQFERQSQFCMRLVMIIQPKSKSDIWGCFSNLKSHFHSIRNRNGNSPDQILSYSTRREDNNEWIEIKVEDRKTLVSVLESGDTTKWRVMIRLSRSIGVSGRLTINWVFWMKINSWNIQDYSRLPFFRLGYFEEAKRRHGVCMFSERARYRQRKYSGEVVRYRLEREHQEDEWVIGLTGNRRETEQGQEDADIWSYLNFTKKEFLFWEKRNNCRSRNNRVLMWQTASQSRNTSHHNHLDSALIRLNSPLIMKTVHMSR